MSRRDDSASPSSSSLAKRHGIDEFDLFCAYHLGITEDGGYRFQNIHHVARRFGTNAAVVKQLLSDLRMDPDVIVQSDFDMADAQVDVMMAPDGVSRIELAREIFAQFRAAPLRKRNWREELERDARENERIFGRR
ncbi:MAG: hypothetical protein ACREQQ_12645 [Candidatus Binatia bacterium]